MEGSKEGARCRRLQRGRGILETLGRSIKPEILSRLQRGPKDSGSVCWAETVTGTGLRRPLDERIDEEGQRGRERRGPRTCEEEGVVDDDRGPSGAGAVEDPVAGSITGNSLPRLWPLSVG